MFTRVGNLVNRAHYQSLQLSAISEWPHRDWIESNWEFNCRATYFMLRVLFSPAALPDLRHFLSKPQSQRLSRRNFLVCSWLRPSHLLTHKISGWITNCMRSPSENDAIVQSGNLGWQENSVRLSFCLFSMRGSGKIGWKSLFRAGIDENASLFMLQTPFAWLTNVAMFLSPLFSFPFVFERFT